VTQAILPRVRDELTPASAALAAADPGTTHATPAASESSTSDAMASFGAADSRARSESARKPALTNEDLRKLLSSPERIDQIRAIELLIDDGSPAANHILIDAFVGSKDRVLLALLEEAMLESPQAFAPVAMSSFETSDDPEVLARLAQLLAGCVQRRPELEHAVVGPWVGSLEMADEFPSRADAATKGLAALGVQAASELGAYLAESSSAPKGVGSAAWLIAQLPVEHAGVVRDELEHGLRSLDVLDTSAIEGTELDALQQKTGSIAWAASLRPEAEHDRLGEVLLASLPRTRDPAQAGTLVWSVGNLKGLSDASRADMTRQLLGAIDTQTDTALGQQYSAMLKQLAAGQSDATRLDELIQMVQDARRVQGQRSSSAPLLDKLLIDMHALQQTSGK
jgi:hypothetical protein